MNTFQKANFDIFAKIKQEQTIQIWYLKCNSNCKLIFYCTVDIQNCADFWKKQHTCLSDIA